MHAAPFWLNTMRIETRKNRIATSASLPFGFLAMTYSEA